MGSSASEMGQTAVDLLDALPSELVTRMRQPFTDERHQWTFYPREMAGKTYVGVPLLELDHDQRLLMMKMARSGLSAHAFRRMSVIMSFDNVLNDMEDYILSDIRDPLRYWMAIYGEPGDTGTWGWRFEGHHVSLNNTIRDGEVLSSTPLFLGANPSEIGSGAHAMIRPCGDEEDAGRELYSLLDDDQRALALLDATAPIDTVVPNVPMVPAVAIPGEPPADLAMFQDVHEAMTEEQKHNLRLEAASPRGIGTSHLDGAQTKLLHELVDVYVGRLPEHLAAKERAKLDAAGWDNLRFAWAGPDQRHEKHYYRVHGPSFMVEYNCVQDDGKHIHAVWRNPQGDFGEDILRAHMASEH